MSRDREAIRRHIAARRAELKAKRRPTTGRWVALALLVLLLAALCCKGCPDEVPEATIDGDDAAPLGPGGVEPSPAPEATLEGRLATETRPALPATPPGPLPWLEAFRLQVGARAPRLAACFIGVPHPGSFHFVARVGPGSGRLSDASLEPLDPSTVVTVEQRQCALEVLTTPDYDLGPPSEAPPRAVRLVVEF